MQKSNFRFPSLSSTLLVFVLTGFINLCIGLITSVAYLAQKNNN